jgi:hypothetical protein
MSYATRFESKLNRLNQLLPAPNVRIIIFTSIGVVTAGIGGGLLNSHPKPIKTAWSLIFIACFFVLLAARLGVINHKHAKGVKSKMPDRIVNALFCFLVAVALFLSGFAVLQENPERGPHVKVLARSPNSEPGKPDLSLELTNAFLFFGWGEKFDPKKVYGVLVVPITGSASNGVLGLAVENDSSLAAEGVNLVALLHTNIICTTNGSAVEGADWKHVSFKDDRWPSFQVWAIRSSQMLHPEDRATCPDLLVRPDGGWANETLPSMLILRAKGMPPQFMAFWVFARRGITSPYLVCIKDVERKVIDGKMRFDLSELP